MNKPPVVFWAVSAAVPVRLTIAVYPVVLEIDDLPVVNEPPPMSTMPITLLLNPPSSTVFMVTGAALLVTPT